MEGHRHALKQRTLLSQNPGMTSADASNSTPADRLLSNLFASQTTSCIVLFGKCNTPLLTGTGAPPIQLIRKTKTGGVVTEDNVTDDNVFIGVDTPEVSAEAKLETALDHAERIRKSLSITGSGLILLAVAWTNDEARRLFEMYPEFHTADVTEKTNAENRPLMMLCGKTAENEAFTSTWVFMPSKCRWVFDWIFGSALPTLHSISTLERNNLIFTDEDDREVGAFDACSIGVNSIYPNSKHR